MMQAGRDADLTETLAAFEGLVITTARMFASQVRREEDDLAQELRVPVWRAVTTYDPARARGSVERYVFAAITNKVKDLRRDAAREARRRAKYGLAFYHIEDTFTPGPGDAHERTPAERFDELHHHVTHDQVYADVESEPFELPAGVTEIERRVVGLLVIGATRDDIALLLCISRPAVDAAVRGLRRKLADWRPATGAVVMQLRQRVERAMADAA